MAPIALGSKHQDLLKAYLEVSKTSNPDWTGIATKADYPTPKYARDQFTIVKNKLLATSNGDPINLSERQNALLKATIEVMKADTDWEKVARVAHFKTSKYARDQWAIVRTRLCGGKGTGDTSSPAKTPVKSKTTSSRKRKKSEEDDNAQHGSVSADEAPTAKSTTKKKKARKAKIEDTEVEDGHESAGTPALPEEGDAEVKLELPDDLEEDFFEAQMFQV